MCVTVCVLCIYFCVSYTGGSPKYEVVYVDSGLWFETMTVHELSNFQKYFPLSKLRKNTSLDILDSYHSMQLIQIKDRP